MDQSVEEIIETFEVIDKKECSSEAGTSDNASSCGQDADMSNNNNNQAEENSQEISRQFSNDDNNNNRSNDVLNRIKKFSRDELLKVKQAMAPLDSTMRKNVLPSIYQEDGTLDKTLDRQKNRSSGNRVGDAIDKMMPQYTQRNSYQKQRSIDHTSNRRSQQGNRANSSQNLIQKRLTTNAEVQLNTAENAWKPTSMVNNPEDTSETETKTAELLRKFRSILNKLTPENFPILIQNLKQLTIDTVDRLDECISLVFEKAITEPNYSASYAQLCKEVSIVFVVPLDEENSQQKAVFKNRLITQCQNEFMRHRDSDIAKVNADRMKQIEDEEDEVKKEELRAEYEFENLKIRRRAVGTVHFIGELYKIEMLTSKIMNSCISHLLDKSMCSEETLECLCKLLTTIGKRLEKTDAKRIDLSEYFSILTKIADKKHPLSISSRIRFMIQDLIDLRMNHWTPRKLQRENKPATMEEIKKQVEMEQYSNKMDIRESDNRNRTGGHNRSRSGLANEDGWSTASYSNHSKKPINFDVKKLNNLPQLNGDIVLGGQGVPSFQNFSTNRFSGLREDDPMPEQPHGSQNNRSYQGRFSGGGQNVNSSNNPPKTSYDRNNRRYNNNNQNRSAGSRSLQPMAMGQNESSNHNKQNYAPNRKISHQPQSRPNDLSLSSFTTQARKISAPARAMTESKGSNLIENPTLVADSIKKLMNSYQCGEMTLDDVIEKLRIYKIDRKVLVHVYNWSFDQHDKERFNVTEILCDCVSHGLLSDIEMTAAYQEIMEIASELACDLPHVFRYIGQLLALPVQKRIVPTRDLIQISKNEIERRNGSTVLKNLFDVFEQKFGKQALCQLYRESPESDFNKFLNVDDSQLKSFLQENNFDYLMENEENRKTAVTSDIDETMMAEIKMTLNSSKDVDSSIQWIQNHVKDTADARFIRSLTTAILDVCLEETSEGFSVNTKKLEIASALLTQFTDGKTEREIICLYAINGKLVELEHPVGCTNDILTCMYDNFLFSKKTFMAWKDDKNPKEQEGKGVTLKSCTGFIEFLKADSNSSDSTGEDQ